MNEISAEESEAIISAAAKGDVLPGHEILGDVLNNLHTVGEATRLAPVSTVRPAGIAGRVARRTAVAATAAVLGFAGAAAAAGTAGLFADEEPPATVAVEEELEDAPADVVPESESDGAGLDDADALDGDTEGGGDSGGRPEIEGVDTSDGLDEEELVLACAGAENHGHYVSVVARDKISENVGTHGERVSQAAATECGKAEEAADGDDSEVEPDEDQGQDPSEVDRQSNGNGNGNGNGKSNGNEHGNSQGHGPDRD